MVRCGTPTAIGPARPAGWPAPYPRRAPRWWRTSAPAPAVTSRRTRQPEESRARPCGGPDSTWGSGPALLPRLDVRPRPPSGRRPRTAWRNISCCSFEDLHAPSLLWTYSRPSTPARPSPRRGPPRRRPRAGRASVNTTTCGRLKRAILRSPTKSVTCWALGARAARPPPPPPRLHRLAPPRVGERRTRRTPVDRGHLQR